MTGVRTPNPRRDLDPAELHRRLSILVGERLSATVADVEPLDGGRSSLTYRATLRHDDEPDRAVVVKVAPPGLEPVANRDVLRQARILNLLTIDGRVPVPKVVLTDPGSPLDVPPLFVMDLVAGSSVEPVFASSGPLPAPDVVRQRAFGATRALAALHEVSVDGMSPPEPVLGVDDEVNRWSRTLRAAGGSAQTDQVRQQLEKALPVPVPPALVHGDFRLGNCLFVGEDLKAVLDWEIWSLGDPRIDLAWLLLTAMPNVHPAADRTPAGMPSVDELLDCYCERAHRPDPTVDYPWFLALALFKMAAMSRHIGKRFAADDPRRTSRESAAERMLAASLSFL